MRALRTEDPARIGEYSVLGRLGQGAMGTVFLARSPGGRLVAVKVARPDIADDPRFRDRFRQEVATMRAVGGFWTAAVVDADPDAPSPWLATEYVSGPTLQDAVTAHGPLPAPALRGLTAGLAEALTAIHAAGLIHRDLKPSNVLLATDGPRVIDFGIAKALESVGLTATGMLIGTPGFLSPEQIEGREVTPASDVFALGAILVFAATAAGPFGSGDAAALMYRAVHATPDVSGVPAELRAVVSRCLNRRPEARPSPADLLAAVGPGGPAEWPPDLHAMVTEQETELGQPPAQPRPPTKHYTRVATPVFPPPQQETLAPQQETPPAAQSRAVFRTSRLSAAVLGSATTAATLICASLWQQASAAKDGGAALLFFIAFLALTVPAARLLWILARPGHRIEISADGLLVARGSRTRTLVWSDLARVRVVEDKRRPWLVVWMRDPQASTVDLGPGYSGGFRIFPVGHERRKPARQRETREIRAALAWYGGTVYDPSP